MPSKHLNSILLIHPVLVAALFGSAIGRFMRVVFALVLPAGPTPFYHLMGSVLPFICTLGLLCCASY